MQIRYEGGSESSMLVRAMQRYIGIDILSIRLRTATARTNSETRESGSTRRLSQI